MSRQQYGSIGSVIERGFNKVLPIPKEPKLYTPPPPKGPKSWIPRGKLGDPVYEEALMDFANEIKAIEAAKSSHIKYSSRGWCYLLEGLGNIAKGGFKRCQDAINDCRKIGLLPIDFIAEDQDETRHFRGIIEAAEPAESLARLKDDTERTLENLAFLSTDFWIGEKFYLMMCVEKGDILNLFKPVCNEYHVPIVSSKGWPPVLLRSHIANLSKKAEANGLKPVLLLFYDHDPAGLKITDSFRKNLGDCRRGTGWSPDNLIIERVGLNKDDIDGLGLSWIENLQTGSGRESKDYGYIQKYGPKKCESNALFRNDETLKAGEMICRRSIEKYYGTDVRRRFKKKEGISKQRLKSIYDNPIWESFAQAIDLIIDSLPVKQSSAELQRNKTESADGKEFEVILDGEHYGVCPNCYTEFDYDNESDIGKLVRCRDCSLPMRLRKAE